MIGPGDKIQARILRAVYNNLIEKVDNLDNEIQGCRARLALGAAGMEAIEELSQKTICRAELRAEAIEIDGKITNLIIRDRQ